jgi:MinD superfamily P-loop ATPase
VLDLAEHFRVPAGVVINKWDLEPELSDRIAGSCRARGVPTLCRIPFDRSVVEAIVQGVPPVLAAGPAVEEPLRELWEEVRRRA